MGGDGRMKKLASQQGKDDIPGIVKDLKAASQDGKEKNAHLLDVLADQSSENVTVMVKAGAIVPLVGLIASGTDGGQIHAASTLARISAANREFQTLIVNAGAITPLVTLLRMGSQKAQMFAAAALASLSEDQEQQKSIIKAGAIAPLVRLVRVGKHSRARAFAVAGRAGPYRASPHASTVACRTTVHRPSPSLSTLPPQASTMQRSLAPCASPTFRTPTRRRRRRCTRRAPFHCTRATLRRSLVTPRPRAAPPSLPHPTVGASTLASSLTPHPRARLAPPLATLALRRVRTPRPARSTSPTPHVAPPRLARLP